MKDNLDDLQAKVSKVISPDDHMFPKDQRIDSYLSVGRSATLNILCALHASGRDKVEAMLDFACGAGRVARWMRAAYPDARFTVADINGSWVDFCASAFDAEPLLSSRNFSDISLPYSYDLIWVGSLITHLPEDDARIILDILHRSLSKDGVLVFTCHGRKVVKNQTSGAYSYISNERFGRILEQTRASGYGFEPHVDGQRVGISLNTLEWLVGWCHEVDDRLLVYLRESGWSNHQDVIAVARSKI